MQVANENTVLRPDLGVAVTVGVDRVRVAVVVPVHIDPRARRAGGRHPQRTAVFIGVRARVGIPTQPQPHQCVGGQEVVGIHGEAPVRGRAGDVDDADAGDLVVRRVSAGIRGITVSALVVGQILGHHAFRADRLRGLGDSRERDVDIIDIPAFIVASQAIAHHDEAHRQVSLIGGDVVALQSPRARVGVELLQLGPSDAAVAGDFDRDGIRRAIDAITSESEAQRYVGVVTAQVAHLAPDGVALGRVTIETQHAAGYERGARGRRAIVAHLRPRLAAPVQGTIGVVIRGNAELIAVVIGHAGIVTCDVDAAGVGIVQEETGRVGGVARVRPHRAPVAAAVDAGRQQGHIARGVGGADIAGHQHDLHRLVRLHARALLDAGDQDSAPFVQGGRGLEAAVGIRVDLHGGAILAGHDGERRIFEGLAGVGGIGAHRRLVGRAPFGRGIHLVAEGVQGVRPAGPGGASHRDGLAGRHLVLGVEQDVAGIAGDWDRVVGHDDIARVEHVIGVGADDRHAGLIGRTAVGRDPVAPDLRGAVQGRVGNIRLVAVLPVIVVDPGAVGCDGDGEIGVGRRDGGGVDSSQHRQRVVLRQRNVEGLHRIGVGVGPDAGRGRRDADDAQQQGERDHECQRTKEQTLHGFLLKVCRSCGPT
ncbi:MAG: hypothetical protein BWY25_01139 [Chloroflexi bacterium ADurb.Bin222]|nr:MAG: hypothetical protein BWY25_01139 [Chloroflexi bacterium ADurb.Bin222]